MKVKTKTLDFLVLDRNLYLYNLLYYNLITGTFRFNQYIRKERLTFTLSQVDLNRKRLPDKELLNKVKKLIKNEDASISLLCRRLKISNYKASKYYWKVRRGLW